MQIKPKVPALTRTFDILSVIAQNGPLTAQEILQAVDLPRSSTYVLLDELIKVKVLHRRSDGRYQLWMRLIALGQSACENIDLRENVAKDLDEMLEVFDCLAVHFGIMDGDKGYYLLKKTHPKTDLPLYSKEGKEISLVNTALGKCLLAYQREEVQERILERVDKGSVVISYLGQPQASTLKEELANIKLMGWAFDNAESEKNIRCVAAPVFSSSGYILGAISVVGAKKVFTEEKIPELVTKVKEFAVRISMRLD